LPHKIASIFYTLLLDQNVSSWVNIGIRCYYALEIDDTKYSRERANIIEWHSISEAHFSSTQSKALEGHRRRVCWRGTRIFGP